MTFKGTQATRPLAKCDSNCNFLEQVLHLPLKQNIVEALPCSEQYRTALGQLLTRHG